MPTKEEDFKKRFIDLLADLHVNGRSDGEAMWLVGSLASNLLSETRLDSWAAFKRALSPEAFSQLLTTFQTQGNSIAAEGKQKAVYAVQVLAVSLIARTQSAPEVVSGEPLLDELIDVAIRGYRQNRQTPATN